MPVLKSVSVDLCVLVDDDALLWRSLEGQVGCGVCALAAALRRLRRRLINHTGQKKQHSGQYLIHDASDEREPAHLCVLVEVTGALLSTLVLPQQTGAVHHGAEDDRPWDRTQRPHQDPLNP